MGQPITQVDAFTDKPFAGNPAGVCMLAAPRDERWMQAVAREMNLSETAFSGLKATATACAGLPPSSKSRCVATPRLPARTRSMRLAHSRPPRRRASSRRAASCAPAKMTWLTLDFPVARSPSSQRRRCRGGVGRAV